MRQNAYQTMLDKTVCDFLIQSHSSLFRARLQYIDCVEILLYARQLLINKVFPRVDTMKTQVSSSRVSWSATKMGRTLTTVTYRIEETPKCTWSVQEVSLCPTKGASSTCLISVICIRNPEGEGVKLFGGHQRYSPTSPVAEPGPPPSCGCRLLEWAHSSTKYVCLERKELGWLVGGVWWWETWTAGRANNPERKHGN